MSRTSIIGLLGLIFQIGQPSAAVGISIRLLDTETNGIPVTLEMGITNQSSNSILIYRPSILFYYFSKLVVSRGGIVDTFQLVGELAWEETTELIRLKKSSTIKDTIEFPNNSFLAVSCKKNPRLCSPFFQNSKWKMVSQIPVGKDISTVIKGVYFKGPFIIPKGAFDGNLESNWTVVPEFKQNLKSETTDSIPIYFEPNLNCCPD